VVQCFERFGEEIDWAMLILSPLEPWPGALALPAAEKFGVKVLTRVADHGGVFHGDVRPGHEFRPGDHRAYRPEGWVEHAWERIEKMKHVAARHDLSLIQFAAIWNLSQPAVESVVPTFIQEAGDAARPIEEKIREFAQVAGPAAPCRGNRRGARGRRQHRLHGAQGRQQAPQHQRAARRVADARGIARDRREIRAWGRVVGGICNPGRGRSGANWFGFIYNQYV
jgi:hypothetical protein